MMVMMMMMMMMSDDDDDDDHLLLELAKPRGSSRGDRGGEGDESGVVSLEIKKVG